MGSETEQPVEKKPKESKDGTLYGAIEWFEDFILVLGIFCIIFTFVVRQISVDGHSMEPNYLDQERVLITAHAGPLVQGDVVVVINAIEEGPIIKRVIATEGQTVDFDADQGRVLVNNTPLNDEQYGVENGITFEYNNEIASLMPMEIPKGCVFVLGDNRQNSKDSRFFGPVDTRNILGKAIWKFYPLSEFGAAG